MLVIKVELYGAVTGERRTLGVMAVTNKGDSDNPNRGNYTAKVSPGGKACSVRKAILAPARQGEVLDYPRKSYSVWRLVARAILSMYPEEARRLAKQYGKT